MTPHDRRSPRRPFWRTRWFLGALAFLPLLTHAAQVKVSVMRNAAQCYPGTPCYVWIDWGASYNYGTVGSSCNQAPWAPVGQVMLGPEYSEGGTYTITASIRDTAQGGGAPSGNEIGRAISTKTYAQIMAMPQDEYGGRHWEICWDCTMGAPPTHYISLTLTNDSNVERTWWIDWDGDGTTDSDEVSTLEAGWSTMRLLSSTNGGWNVSAYRQSLDDNNLTWDSIVSWGTNQWNVTTGVVNYTTPWTPSRTDTQSQTNRRVVYAAPSGGNLSESTFQTGLESLRTAQLEGLEKVAESVARLGTNLSDGTGQYDGSNVVSAVDRARTNLAAALETNRTNLLDALGFAARQTNATDTLARSTNATASYARGLTNDLGPLGSSISSSFGTPAGVAPAAGFWNLALPGGRVISWNLVDRLGDLLAFARSAIMWCAWLFYLSYCTREGLQNVQTAMRSPQAVSSSTVPVFSTGLSVAAAVLILVFIGAALGLVTTSLAGLLTDPRFDIAQDWKTFVIQAQGFTISTGNLIYVADLLLPWSALIALSVSAVVFSVNARAISIALAGLIRGTTT